MSAEDLSGGMFLAAGCAEAARPEAVLQAIPAADPAKYERIQDMKTGAILT